MKVVTHSEGGRTWAVQVSDDAPQEAIKYAKERLKKEADWELRGKLEYERKKTERKELVNAYDNAVKELVAQAEAIIGEPLPCLESYALSAVSFGILPIYSNLERQIIYDIRRNLPAWAIQQYKDANHALEEYFNPISKLSQQSATSPKVNRRAVKNVTKEERK